MTAATATAISAGPASFIQRSMWAIAQRHRSAPINVMILPWRVTGPLDADVLAAAMTDVVERHAALRTRLVMIAGQLAQVVDDIAPVVVACLDVEGETPDARLESALSMLRDEGRVPIDIVVGPPLKVRLLRLGSDDHVLGLLVHHAVCDGWSSQLIVDDLARFYDARLQGSRAELPPLAESTVDHARSQIETHDSGGYADELAYWRTELSELAPPLALPVIAPRKGNRDWRAVSPCSSQPEATLAALKSRSRRARVSTFSMLLAALALLMHQRTGSVDIVIGVPTLGRWSPQAMRFVGCATNMLPARIRIDPSGGFDDLAAQVHATIRRLMAYGRVPLELVLREIQDSVLAGPVFPVWCQLRENAPMVTLMSTPTSFTSLLVERGALLSELDVDMLESAGGLQTEFAHRPGLFDASMVSALMADWDALLRALVDGSSNRVDLLCRQLTPASADGE